MAKRFEGVYPPIITPLTRDDAIDEEGLRKLVDFWIDEGLHGLIPTGSTGQGPLLLHEERKKMMDIVIDQVNGRVPVVPATGCTSTKETIMFSKYAQDAGANGVMVVHPYYSLIGEKELYEHYKAVATAINIPVIMYNNPFTTGKDAKPPLIAKLAEDGYIFYVKESSGYLQRVPDIIRLSDGKVTVLIGVDDMHFEAFKLGARGWIAGIANFIPRQCVEVFNLAVRDGNFEKAHAANEKIRPIGELVEGSGKFVQYCKYGLEVQGKPAGLPRMPILPLTENEKGQFKRLLDRAGIPFEG